MEPSISIWRRHDNIYGMQFLDNTERTKTVSMHMSIKFGQRDKVHGHPHVPRYDAESAIINFTMRDIAEAFFLDFSSQELADYIASFASSEDTDPDILETIAILDQYYHCAYVLDESRGRGQWDFWRIYAPDYTSAELAKMIPKKYWSKSKYGEIIADDDTIEHHFSPMLKVGNKFDYRKALLGYFSGVPKEDEITLKKMEKRGRSVSARDELRLNFLRRWHHPLLIMYNDKYFEMGNAFPQQGIDERMAHLKVAYPRLNEEQFTIKGHDYRYPHSISYQGNRKDTKNGLERIFLEPSVEKPLHQLYILSEQLLREFKI